MLDEFIKQANEEFEQNGRSDKLIAMENRILKNGKVIPAYCFARYVKGASAKRFQKFCIARCSLAEAYYFVKHIPGFEIQPFIERSMEAEDDFWLGKFNELDLKNGGKTSKKRSKKNDDIACVIKRTNEEYKKNPYSEETKRLLLEALHTNEDGNFDLYARDIKGLDIKDIQKFAILRGNPLTMLIIAKDVEGINMQFMLMGLIMSKFDYVKMEEVENAPHRGKRSVDYENINNDVDEEELGEPLSRLTYVEQVNNYMAQLGSLIKAKGAN